MTHKLTRKYIKRQIKYFTLRHKKAESLTDKLHYSKLIYFWEKKLKYIKSDEIP